MQSSESVQESVKRPFHPKAVRISQPPKNTQPLQITHDPLPNPPPSPSTAQTHTAWRLHQNGATQTIKILKLLGHGTFGQVYKCLLENDVVAIKKQLLSPRHAFREVEVLSSLDHLNVVRYKSSFQTSEDGQKVIYIVMEYVHSTLFETVRRCRRAGRRLTERCIMLLMYQLFQALRYIHGKNICHRDLKPANILLNVHTRTLKLADFGSAKHIRDSEESASYVCSRYYRAPELILSCPYNTKMDIWSAGCVMAELYLSDILFKGETGVDQLVEIIRILGTPSELDLQEMGKKDLPFAHLPVAGRGLGKVLRSVGESALDLLGALLAYSPKRRLTAEQALRHRYFDRINAGEFEIEGVAVPDLYS